MSLDYATQGWLIMAVALFATVIVRSVYLSIVDRVNK